MQAPLIAIVGCDGSGKSTLAADIAAELARERTVAVCYLGLGSGTLGQRIAALPLIGPLVTPALTRRAKRTRTTGERIPGLSTALVVYAFSLARRRRFRRMLALRRAGATIITDRYPQIEVPGFYDGPGLSAAQAGSRAVARLATRERRMYVWMAGHLPDIVIRLNVDLATAHSRKPDHDPALLAQKIAATAQLRFGGALIVDIDARADYGEVRRQVMQAVRPVLDADGAPVGEQSVARIE